MRAISSSCVLRSSCSVEGRRLRRCAKFKDRHTFLHRSTGDAEEVLAIPDREASVAFGDVGGHRQGRSIQLVDEEAVATGEMFGSQADLISEIDRLLIDEELLESERHRATEKKAREEKVESRPGRGVAASLILLRPNRFSLSFLLSPLSPLFALWANGG